MAFIASNARLGLVDLSTVTNLIGTPFTAGNVLPSVTLEPQLGETCTGWDANLGGGEFAYFKCAGTVVASQTISSITISAQTTTGNITTATATVTTASAHGLTLGANSVTITGAVPNGYNGTYQVVTVPTTTTFTYTISYNNSQNLSTNIIPTISATTVGTYVAGIGAGAVCELAYSLANGYLTITATPWTGTTIQGKPLYVALNNMAPNYYGWFQYEGAAIAVVNGTITVNGPLYWQANGTVSNTAVASKQFVSATAASLVSSVIGQGSTAVTLPAYQAVVFVNSPTSQDAIT